jgi:hypothetical protein
MPDFDYIHSRNSDNIPIDIIVKLVTLVLVMTIHALWTGYAGRLCGPREQQQGQQSLIQPDRQTVSFQAAKLWEKIAIDIQQQWIPYWPMNDCLCLYYWALQCAVTIRRRRHKDNLSAAVCKDLEQRCESDSRYSSKESGEYGVMPYCPTAHESRTLFNLHP